MRWQRTEQSEKQQQEYDELQEKPSNWFSKHFNRIKYKLRPTDASKTAETSAKDNRKG